MRDDPKQLWYAPPPKRGDGRTIAIFSFLLALISGPLGGWLFVSAGRSMDFHFAYPLVFVPAAISVGSACVALRETRGERRDGIARGLAIAAIVLASIEGLLMSIAAPL